MSATAATLITAIWEGRQARRGEAKGLLSSSHLADDELVLVGVKRRLVHLYPVLLQHVQEGRFARIVQSQE